LYNVASCWSYLKEYINDARSRERQKKNRVKQWSSKSRVLPNGMKIKVVAELMPQVVAHITVTCACRYLLQHTVDMVTWGSVGVKALRYKSEGPGINSRCRREFFRGI
jgi:hypothetical protein